MKYLTMILALISSAALAELNIKNAIVPEAPPTAKVLTAYMQLHNHSDAEQAIVAIRSPQFKRIEMHKTEIINDIASMTPIELIRIPAHGMAELKSGGMHLMMFKPNARYSDGDCVELILEFKDGTTQSVRANVKKRDQQEDHSHHHHHH